MNRVSRPVVVTLVAVCAVFAAGMALTRPPSPAGHALDRADRVVVVGMPTLTFADLADMPQLSALRRRGAVGALTARLANRSPTSADVYAALGASSEAAMPAGFGATVPDRATGGVRMPGAVEGIRRNRRAHRASLPGALGDALAAHAVDAAAIGNADSPGPASSGQPNYRPVNAAVMTSDGRVAHGSLGGPPNAPGAPGGRLGALAEPGLQSLQYGQARLTVLDYGDLDRLAALDPPPSAAQYRQLRQHALALADGDIAAISDAMGPRTLLLVVGLDPGATRRLTPVVALGPGVRAGSLVSPSTGRLGVVTLADIAPTILHALDVPVPAAMVGQPLRSTEAGGDHPLTRLAAADRDARRLERQRGPITDAAALAAVAFGLFALLVLSPLGRPRRSGWLLAWAALVIASLPVAILLAGFLPGRAGTWSPAVIVGLAIAAPLIAATATTTRMHAFVAIQATTAFVIVVDLLTGSRLQTSTALGSSLLVAARFRGIGNAGVGTLVAATVVVSAAIARRVAVPLLVVVTAVVCLPMFGAKVGGIFVLVPVFVGLGAVLLGRSLSARIVMLAGAAVVAVLGLAIAVDAAFPGRTRSHLGRLVGSTTATGGDSLAAVVGRKISSGVHVARSSQWMPAAVVLAAVVVTVLWAWGGWRTTVPRGSTERMVTVALLVAAGLGLVTSDSGILTTALVLVAAVPYLVLLNLDGDGSITSSGTAATAATEARAATTPQNSRSRWSDAGPMS